MNITAYTSSGKSKSKSAKRAHGNKQKTIRNEKQRSAKGIQY